MVAELTAGAPAPDFDLPTDDGGRVSLGAFAGRKLVLYFYPKDDTTGCTREAIDFSALMDEFEAAGASVVGVSPDDPDRHRRFRAKHELTVTLASDTDRTVLEAYGVWVEKSMYGRSYMGIERATFLIGRDGRIARVWRKVRVPGHAEEVLAAAAGLA